jgi:hypothetical protein
MTWTYVEEGDGVSHGAESAVDSSETFEEFYAREFPAIVALAYALSGSRAARRTSPRRPSWPPTATGTVWAGSNAPTSGCAGS